MNAIKVTGLAVWQLPQNIIGAVLFLAMRPARTAVEVERQIVFVKVKRFAVTLGQFVFWTDQDLEMVPTMTDNRLHEFGHSVQSRWLGPLYLIVVGIPSILRNVYAMYHFYRHRKRWENYYKGFPENWADHLSGRQQ